MDFDKRLEVTVHVGLVLECVLSAGGQVSGAMLVVF